MTILRFQRVKVFPAAFELFLATQDKSSSSFYLTRDTEDANIEKVYKILEVHMSVVS